MCASGRSRFQIDGARGCVIGGDPKWQSRCQLFIFFVLVFVLQIVVIFLIAWFADWLGRISRVEFHALVLFIGIRAINFYASSWRVGPYAENTTDCRSLR